MAGSNSYERGGQPRTVPDADAAAYKAMIREQRTYNERQEAKEAARRLARNVPPTLSGEPMRGTVESRPRMPTVNDVVAGVTHVLGGPRRAREKWEHGRRVEALVDGAVAASDLYLGKSATTGLLKGQVKVKGPHAWRTKPWQEGEGAREWMGRTGQLAPGQHGHHALIPQNGWGKSAPDWIKNQPANIKGMESPAVHGRIHGPYKGEPQYSYLSRYWLGTPGWWKASNASAGGRVAQGAIDEDK